MTGDRLIVVSATALTDVLDLVDRALPSLDAVLADALRGSAAELRSSSVLEPA